LGTLVLAAQPAKLPSYQLRSAITINADKLRLTALNLQRASGDDGRIRGALGLNWQPQPTWDTQLELVDLNLQAELSIPTRLSGTLAISGDLARYAGQFDLRNTAADWQQIALRGALAGTDTQLTLKQLRGKVLNGEVQGDLDLNWQNALVSNFRMSGRQIDLARLPAGPEGHIDLRLDGWLAKPPDQPLHIGGRAEIFQAEVLDQQFGGEIRGVWRGGRNLHLEQLKLNGAWGKLSAQGDLTRHLDLDLELIDAAALWPASTGSGTLTGWLAWPATWPQGEITASLHDLAYGDLKASSLKLAASQTTSAAQHELHLQIDELEAADYRFENLSLDGQGRLDQHQLDAQFSYQNQQLKLALTGALSDEQWQGQFTALELSIDNGQVLHLQNPAPLRIAQQQIQLSSLQLVGEGGALNLNGGWQRATGRQEQQAQVSLALEDFPVHLFNPWLPDGQRVDGRLRGTATGELQQDGRFNLHAQADISEGIVAVHNDTTKLDIPLQQVGLKIDWQQQQLHADLQLRSDTAGLVSGLMDLNLPARWHLAGVLDAPLRARLDYRLQESGVLSILLPEQLADLGGQLAGHLQLSGNLRQPDMRGKLQLAEGQLNLPQLAIRLQPIEIEATFARQTLTIDRFLATSGGAQLRGQGEIIFNAWQPERYRFRLQGESVLLVNLPEIRALASPDLIFSNQDSRLNISGRLAIPELSIVNWHPTLSVSPSDDVVYVDSRPTAPPATSPYRLEIDLELGDNVVVKEKGLDVKLSGKVHLNKAPGGPTLARGQINIPKGHYSFYTVKLPISSGRLYFNGGPVDNPTLDIIANRTVGQITSGVQLSGTVRRPIAELVSDPAMDDTEILAYIVLGHSTTTSSGELDMLSLAAGALLSAGDSASMQQKIKNLGGIDVVSVESGQNGDLETTMVTVGKYLSPELYLSYGRSLTGTASEVQLRYSPGKRIEVETQLGEVSGADLYYKFEFN
jgi:translocation and assembly module TamB